MILSGIHTRKRPSRHPLRRLANRTPWSAVKTITATVVVLGLIGFGLAELPQAAVPIQTASVTSTPPVGWWDGAPDNVPSPVVQSIYGDYATNGSSDYCGEPQDGANVPGTLMLAVGACTTAQSTAIANSLVAAGQSHAIIRIMWEGNQGLDGWFQNWNQLTFKTAASYIAAFNTVEAAFKAVSPNFVIVYNPNGGDNNSGETLSWQSEDPGTENVIAVDQYDTGSYEANIQAVESYAQSKGLPWAIPEWGLDGSDDPTYINSVAALVNAPGADAAFEAYFSYDGGIDSYLSSFPNSKAAYINDFSVSGGTTTTTAPGVTTTTTGGTTTTTAPGCPSVSTLPAVPTNVKASVSGTSVTITWANPCNALGNDVYVDSTKVAYPGYPSAPVQTYTVTGVASGSHTIAVTAWNSGGDSAKSTPVTIQVGTTTTTTTTVPPTTTTTATPVPSTYTLPDGIVLTFNANGTVTWTFP